jgi:hypothetical protein
MCASKGPVGDRRVELSTKYVNRYSGHVRPNRAVWPARSRKVRRTGPSPSPMPARRLRADGGTGVRGTLGYRTHNYSVDPGPIGGGVPPSSLASDRVVGPETCPPPAYSVDPIGPIGGDQYRPPPKRGMRLRCSVRHPTGPAPPQKGKADRFGFTLPESDPGVGGEERGPVGLAAESRVARESGPVPPPSPVTIRPASKGHGHGPVPLSLGVGGARISAGWRPHPCLLEGGGRGGRGKRKPQHPGFPCGPPPWY